MHGKAKEYMWFDMSFNKCPTDPGQLYQTVETRRPLHDSLPGQERGERHQQLWEDGGQNGHGHFAEGVIRPLFHGGVGVLWTDQKDVEIVQ